MNDKVIQPVVVESTFNAPVSKVWKALTNKEAIKQWSFEMKEFKPQEGFEFEFYGEKDGVKYLHHSKITKVILEKKLSYTWWYEGHEGTSLVTFELSAQGHKTKLKLIHEGLETFPKTPDFARENFIAGWKQIIGENLKKFVEKSVFIISRIFDAPRDLVWDSCTKPERMTHWWGPKGCTVRVAKMDFRVGGTYHCCMRSPDGRDTWGKFTYCEIIKPEKIVFVNSFSDENGGLTRHPLVASWPLEMLSAFTFAQKDGKTVFTIEWTPLNPTDIELKTFEDGMESMKQGWTGTLDQLNTYLNEKRAERNS